MFTCTRKQHRIMHDSTPLTNTDVELFSRVVYVFFMSVLSVIGRILYIFNTAAVAQRIYKICKADVSRAGQVAHRQKVDVPTLSLLCKFLLAQANIVDVAIIIRSW